MTTQKDQKTKEETERRDRLIFELITERFRLEWQRISDLDGKAMGIMALRCFMWVDVVRMLSNNQKSEEKRGTNMALNPKIRMKNVGGGNCKSVS